MANWRYYRSGPNKNYNPKSLANLRPRKKGEKSNSPVTKKGRHVRPWLIVLMEEFKVGKVTQEFVARRLVYMAAKGDLRAMQILFDRMEGKSPQPLTLEAGKSFIDLVREGRQKLVVENKELSQPTEADWFSENNENEN